MPPAADDETLQKEANTRLDRRNRHNQLGMAGTIYLSMGRTPPKKADLYLHIIFDLPEIVTWPMFAQAMLRHAASSQSRTLHRHCIALTA